MPKNKKLILLLYGIEEMLTVDAALEEAHIGS